MSVIIEFLIIESRDFPVQFVGICPPIYIYIYKFKH